VLEVWGAGDEVIRFFSKTVFLLALVLLLGCSAATRLDGMILDQNKQPIEGATIVLDVEGRHGETLSKGDGIYNLRMNHPPGPRWVTVSKPGYKTVRKKLRGGVEVHLNVVLKPEAGR
jgi:hypothetical protein